MKKSVVALCVLAFCASVNGCSETSNRGVIGGNITLDGKPLKTGLIRFVPADGKTATAESRIIGGKYSASARPGEKKVFISSPKVIGKRKLYDTPNSPSVATTQERLPARYNVQSELTLNVSVGRQSQDFDLKSDK